MAARDYIALLAPDGDARAYFKKAANGEAWVDKVFDDIRAQLMAKVEYIALDEPLTEMIEELVQDPLTRRVHLGRTLDMRWQLSVDFFDTGGWTVVIADTIPDAVAKLYAQEKQVRFKYNMKGLQE